MSHEIRTPMNGVVGMIDILQTTTLSREQHRMLGTVHDSALSLLNILNDILDFSKIEANKLELELLPTQLRELAEGVTQLMNTAALLKKIRLSAFVDPAVPHWIQTDPTRVRQVLLNLLGNSIKFTSERGSLHGEVSLRVTCCKLSDDRDGIELCVRDNGIGMSPQSMAKLFQPFVQAEASTARTFGGTGLGLSITQRLVELLGGKISVASTLGQGSEFCVQLPLQTCEPGYGEGSLENGRSTPMVVLTDASGQETARFADARKSVRATKSADGNAHPLDGPGEGLILLAEDNETNRDVMRQQLSILGYAVEEAHDGVIALDMWRSGRYSLLLTDCEMPNLDGFGLSEAIRSEEPPGQRIPIIAVTAHAMQGESQRCKDHGMDDYLTKPLRMHALADMLAKWLPAATPGAPQPATPDAGVESPPWNPSVLTEMIGDNPTIQTRLLTRYLELTRIALAGIETAVATADIKVITAQAHKLKSASRSVGALLLGDLCDQIEVCGMAQDAQACLELAGTLAAEFNTVEAHILEYLSSH
jgi:CheY-like chemotaxis protein/HPt (histidine-containing phosphotransfer) domain-containing protein